MSGDFSFHSKKATQDTDPYLVLHDLVDHQNVSHAQQGGPRSQVLEKLTKCAKKSVHEWLFAETDGGGVVVTTNQSFAGDPVSADVAGMQAQFDIERAADALAPELRRIAPAKRTAA